jgi:hypothetical protein
MSRTVCYTGRHSFPARGHARAEENPFVIHGRFYGLRNFCRKTAQFGETLREPAWQRAAVRNTLRNVMKNCAKTAL